MTCDLQAHSTECHQERHIAQGSSTRLARQDIATFVAERLRSFQDLDVARRQRHPMLSSSFHGFGRHFPYITLNFVPTCTQHLTSSSGYKNGELKGKLYDLSSPATSEPPDKVCHLGVGKRRMVTVFPGLLRQGLGDALNRILARSQMIGPAPVQNRLHALTYPARRLWRCQPDRRKHLEDFGTIDLINAVAADDRKGIIPERIDPLLAMLSVLPSRRVLFMNPLHRLFEVRDYTLRLTSISEGITILRMAKAASRASASDTTENPPRPI